MYKQTGSKAEYTRRQFSNKFQSRFDQIFACWANNHNGWRKMVKVNRKAFKRKFKQETKKEIERQMEEL